MGQSMHKYALRNEPLKKFIDSNGFAIGSNTIAQRDIVSGFISFYKCKSKLSLNR